MCFVVLLLVWIFLYLSAYVWDLRHSRTVKDPMPVVSHNIKEVWHSFLHHINAVFCILSIGAINCGKKSLTKSFLGILWFLSVWFVMVGRYFVFWRDVWSNTHRSAGWPPNHSWAAVYINFSTSIMMSGSRETRGPRLPRLRLFYHPAGWKQGCCLPPYNKKLLASRVYHRLVLLWSPSPSQQEAQAPPRGRLCYLFTGILILKTGRGWMT